MRLKQTDLTAWVISRNRKDISSTAAQARRQNAGKVGEKGIRNIHPKLSKYVASGKINNGLNFALIGIQYIKVSKTRVS